jgi:hypothetical protein
MHSWIFYANRASMIQKLQATRDAVLRENENVVTEHFGQLKAIEVA